MAIEVKAPNEYDKSRFTIFLAGSIDMGEEKTNWQEKVVKALKEFNITILNPRRQNWNKKWKQEEFAEPFRSQVLWEYKGMKEADLILFVFTKDSKSPVTMYELGRFASIKDSIVCVESGFYRQGNLDIYTSLDDIPIYHDLNEMIEDLKTILAEKI